MTLIAGKDYAFAKQVSGVFESGVGKAFALATKKHVFLMPYDTLRGGGRKVTTTKVTLGGVHPVERVLSILADPNMTIEALDEQILAWAKDDSSCRLKALAVTKRIKLRNGFFSRNVAFSEKEKGFETGFGSLIAFRPTKAETTHFFSLYEGDPRLV